MNRTQSPVAARTPWYTHPIRLIVICGIVLVAVVVAVTASLLLNLRDRDLTEKERSLERLAVVLAEEIDHLRRWRQRTVADRRARLAAEMARLDQEEEALGKMMQGEWDETP